jgi:long-chain fatty acid transport protein
MNRDCPRKWLVPLAFAVLAPTAVRAQGFGLNEIGSCAVARAFANTGAPCKDASAIYWNPGATTELPGFSLYGGASGIRLNGAFAADSSGKKYHANVPWAVPPAVFLNYATKVGDHGIALGFGYYIPYGLISEWRSDFPGRFESQRASLNTMYFQPNIAFELIPHRLSIGAGPVIGYSTVRLDQAQDLSVQGVPGTPLSFAQFGIAPGTEFAVATLKGSATAAGFNVGVHAKVSDDLQLGGRFLSQMVFSYSDANATFRQVATGLVLPTGNPLNPGINVSVDSLLKPQFAGPLAPQKVSTKITHPYQAQVGLGYTGLSQTTLSLDWALIGYSGFKALPITFSGGAAAANRTLIEDYHDSWSIRAGIEHVFGDPVVGFVGRAGFAYTATPAPDVTVTPLLPDMNRYNFSVGFGYPLSKQASIDFAYLHVGTEGRRGRTVERSSVVNTNATAVQLNDGFYTLAANVLSLSLKLGL